MSVFVTGAGIPSGAINYLNYIQSTGTQYIDTGITGNSNIKIQPKFEMNDDVLVRDYAPCLDKNGTVCMYDKVNKEYVYNSGTGEFIGG